MLTRLQRQSAPCIANSQERQAYRTHMCGLCHSLGDHYGLLFRWLTTREMILLNVLTNAQCRAAPAQVVRCCPLNPLRQVTTNQDVASKFAAATSVELANLSFADDVQDSGGLDIPARLASWALRKPHQAALQVLADLDFETRDLTRLSALQTLAEQDETTDAARPSAMISARLFAMTAQLAGNPQNEAALAMIGANFGTYIYLTDAYRDFSRDMARGDYNPLRRFSQPVEGGFTLSLNGLVWLLDRFREIQANISQEMARLHLYRYQDMVTRLLGQPLDKVVLELSQQVQRQQQPAFRPWQLADALKAALFIFPAAEAGAGLMAAYSGYEEPGLPEDQKRRQSGDSACRSCGYVPWCDGSDMDCGGCGGDGGDGGICNCGDGDGCGGDCGGGDCSGGDCS